MPIPDALQISDKEAMVGMVPGVAGLLGAVAINSGPSNNLDNAKTQLSNLQGQVSVIEGQVPLLKQLAPSDQIIVGRFLLKETHTDIAKVETLQASVHEQQAKKIGGAPFAGEMFGGALVGMTLGIAAFRLAKRHFKKGNNHTSSSTGIEAHYKI